MHNKKISLLYKFKYFFSSPTLPRSRRVLVVLNDYYSDARESNSLEREKTIACQKQA